MCVCCLRPHTRCSHAVTTRQSLLFGQISSCNPPIPFLPYTLPHVQYLLLYASLPLPCLNLSLSLSGGAALRVSHHAPRGGVEVHRPQQSAPQGSGLREVQRGSGARTSTRTAPTHVPSSHVLGLKARKMRREERSSAEQQILSAESIRQSGT